MKKHTLGKIEPKQIIAHPKNEKSKAEYVKHNCVECDIEYLTQAILQHEMDFCPNHVDLRFCETCCEVVSKDECKQDDDDLWHCNDCFTYKCRQCDAEMNEDIKFCSRECYQEYIADISEDEYKERNRY
tara:strand:+ start:2174 stop:2560 length:387 start_codon:yes stop_codon:yes gene_type:complete